MNNISLGTYRRQKNTWKHVITISHYKHPHSVIITCLSEQLKLKTSDSSKVHYKFRETMDGWHGSMGNDLNSIPKTHMVGENWLSHVATYTYVHRHTHTLTIINKKIQQEKKRTQEKLEHLHTHVSVEWSSHSRCLLQFLTKVPFI